MKPSEAFGAGVALVAVAAVVGSGAALLIVLADPMVAARRVVMVMWVVAVLMLPLTILSMVVAARKGHRKETDGPVG